MSFGSFVFGGATFGGGSFGPATVVVGISSPATIVGALLVQLGLTDEDATFVSFLPDETDEGVCCYDTEGLPDGRIMRSGEQIEHPGVQVFVRGKDYTTVWNLVNDIATALSEQRNVIVDVTDDESRTIKNISRQGTPIGLGMEKVGDRRCHSFALNITLTL